MDEPLSNLDAKLRVQTRAEIARLHQRLKTTIVYVTHDQVEAMTMGQRIAVMSQAKLQQVGPPQELYDHPINKFVAGFIGSPAMNFIPVTLDGTGEGARLKGAGIELPLPAAFREGVGATTGRDFIVGVRPEHLDVAEVPGEYATTQSKADVVEYLGNEELLHIEVAGVDIVAIVSSERGVRPGDVVTLHFPLEKIHLFDAATELSVRRTRVELSRRAPLARPPSPQRGAGPPGPARRRRGPDNRGMPDPDRRAPADPLDERLVESTVVHRGRVLEFRVDTVERADGRRARRDVAGHPGAVAIVALDPEERVLLVRQYRHPAGRVLLEIPAGTLDRDPATGATEDPDDAARRELEEETGYRAGRWERLVDFWTAPGFATERMFLYLATDLAPAGDGRLGPDEDEALELVRLPWREAVAAAERGEIRDAKSLVGLLWLARRLEAAPPR